MQTTKPRKGYKLVKMSFRKKEEIPEDWTVKKLKDLSNDITSGNTAPQSQIYSDEGILFVRVSDLKNNYKFISKTKDRITLDNAKKYGLRLYPKGSIIMTKSGISLLHNYRKILSQDSFVVNHNAIIISNKCNLEFLYYCLSIIDLGDICNTTSLPSVNLSDINKIIIKYPPRQEEQKAIASILSNVDDAIQSTDEIIGKTKELKQGLMHKFLTKGIGHKKYKKVETLFTSYNNKYLEIPETWVSKKLSYFFNLYSGATPLTSKPENYGGNLNWINSHELNYNYIYNSLNKITSDGVADANLKVIPINIFLIAITGLEAKGTRGRCAILGTDSYINQSCMAFLPKLDVFIKFVYYWYLYNSERLYSIYCQGTKQQSYTQKILEHIVINIPTNINEQKAIAEILSNVDEEIQKEELYKSNLEKLKKGLMQQLLTGKIRVKF